MHTLILFLLFSGADPNAGAKQLFQKAFEAQLEGQPDRAMELYRQAIACKPDARLRRAAHYGIACIAATQEKNEMAIRELELAFAHGHHDVEALLEEPDLASLRDTPDFKKLVEKYRQAERERRHLRARPLLEDFKPFAFDLDVVDLRGKRRRLEDLRGQVVIVNFWGTWCPPCRREMPHLVELDRRHRKAGLRIIGLAKERHASSTINRRNVSRFVRQVGVQFPVALCPDPALEQLPGEVGFPTSLFIDRRGRVRYRLTGFRGVEIFEDLVVTLMDEKPESKAADDN